MHQLPRFLLLFLAWVCSCVRADSAVPEIQHQDFGYRLPTPEDLGLWWCEAARKVARDRALPTAPIATVALEAARNEYESFQLVICPRSDLTLQALRVGPWTGNAPDGSDVIRDFPCTIHVVEYVPVLDPSDSWGAAGDWPDVLVPFSPNLALPADLHQPVFITLFIPPDTPAGLYTGALELEFEGDPPVQVPLQLRVFDFTLPEATHTRTAYYSDVHVDPTWHRLATPEQRQQTWDLYMQMYRRYRIAPYSPHLYAPITWSYTNGTLNVDFGPFDAVMSRYLDEFGFNAFNLFGHKSPPFPNPLGGYYAYSTNWFVRFSELMDRIGHHLRLRGWMDRAYCYWADEPQGPRFNEIITGMDALRAAAPDLQRLLTFNNPPAEPYDTSLNGRVDIWTPMAHLAVTPRFTNRLALGEELWWYVAVAPTAPYPNYFIDHPAVAHRIRFWAQKVHGVTGDLYYAINMWMGRNPWEVTRTWDWSPANGDGVLVYPPTRVPPSQPVIAAPLPTLRLEQVRDGLEDLEYFWLADQWLERATHEQGPESPIVNQLRWALSNALALVPHVSRVQLDVPAMLNARRALAEAIEAAEDGRLWWVTEPIDRAAGPGERCVLSGEALGWPPPVYQWFLNDQPIPGATNRHLVVESFGPEAEGVYYLVAANSRGALTSRLARVWGTWSRAPIIVQQPRGRVVPEGASVVLTVAAVPEEVLGYQWYRDGEPLSQPTATNAALDLGRVTTADSGNYSVVVWNAQGSVTSEVATVIVAGFWSTRTLVSNVQPWSVWLDPSPPPGDWISAGFDDSDWTVLRAPLGFGRSNLVTVLDPRHARLPPTMALRTRFYAHWRPGSTPTLQVVAADGVAVYLNGHRVHTSGVPEGTEPPWGPATAPAPPDADPVSVPIPAEALVPGWNTLAVTLHRFVADDPPVAWWSFDDPDGWGQDELQGHPLTLRGAGPALVPGIAGWAVTNAGAQGWLETADSPAFQIQGPFTVGGWFAFGQQTGDDPASIAIEKPGEWALYYTGTRLNRYRFRLGTTEVQDPTSGTVSGQWRFVVAWFDGTNASIQVDAGPVTSVPVQPPAPGREPVRLLRRTGPLGGFAADEVFFYNRVLSAEERSQLRQHGVARLVQTQSARFYFQLRLTGEVATPPVLTGAVARLIQPAGRSAWLSLGAVSAWPVRYFWLKDGEPLPGATQGLLRWDALQPGDTGWYSLVASNIGGAVTSAPVRVAVVLPPQLHLIRSTETGTWQLAWSHTVPDVTGILETSTDLTQWTEVQRWRPWQWPSEPALTVPAAENQRFYRLRLEW